MRVTAVPLGAVWVQSPGQLIAARAALVTEPVPRRWLTVRV